MPCDVCNGTGVVWSLFAGAIDEAVPCAACRVGPVRPTGYVRIGDVFDIINAETTAENLRDMTRVYDRVAALRKPRAP